MAHVQRKNLLTISTDANTVKGEKLGILTGVLYLAPADVSGYEVCPKASAGCKAACLYTAGRGVMAPVVAGRINRTLWLHEDRDSFMDTLVADIQRLIRKAARKGMVPAVRLNGTSDIAWETPREDGPGIEWASGTRKWYLNGTQLTEAEFNARQHPTCNGKVVEIDGKKYKLMEV